MKRTFVLLSILLASAPLACGPPAERVEETPEVDRTQAPGPQASADPMPSEAVGQPDEPDVKVPIVDPPPAAGPGLTLVAPDGWVPEAPSSAFRAAQYRLPRAEGDAEDAELVVFRMAAGSFSQNVQRWTEQFVQPDGRPSGEVATRSTRRVNDMPVHEFECSGTYVAETMPGSGERLDKPGTRMLAAVVESPYGPYYFKLVGPDATVAQWRSSYTGFLSSLEP